MKRLVFIDHMFGHTRVEFKVLYVRTTNRSTYTGKRARVFRVLFQVSGQEWKCQTPITASPGGTDA